MSDHDVGDIVIYYIHESWDNNHTTVDSPAIVLATFDDSDDLVLQVFPKGGEPFQTQVGPWPDDIPRDADGKPIVGSNFWRDRGEDPPDFAEAMGEKGEAPADTPPVEDAKPKPMRL